MGALTRFRGWIASSVAVGIGLLVSISIGGHVRAAAPFAPPSAISSAIGYDVSYPQCGSTLPKHLAFAVVGVNDTLANNFNQCLDSEASWAASNATGGTTQPKVSFYVHTADPGNAVADWPKFGTNPEGECNGSNSIACAYQYGENLALNDLLHLGGMGYKGAAVYIDAETGYAYGPPARNDAVLEGMSDAFRSSGDTVGVYSNMTEWQAITGGATRSALKTLPVWALGATSVTAAQQNCATPSFAGPTVMAQAAGTGIDLDVACKH